MFCKKCGQEIRSDYSFCINCGTEVEKEVKYEDVFAEEEAIEWKDFEISEVDELDENIVVDEEDSIKEIETMPEVEDMEEEKVETQDLLILEKEPKENILTKGSTIEEIISIILGASSLTLSLFLSIFTLPMSISGLVFAEYGKHKNNKSFSMGKVVNVISLFTAVAIACLYLSSASAVITNFAKTLDNIPLEPYYQIEEQPTTSIEKVPVKQEENIVEEKEKPVETQKKRKFTNIGYMEYEIPAAWTFNGIKDTGNNAIANVFSRDNDTVFLAIKSVDITGANFSKEMLENEIITAYGSVANSGTFSTSNGLEWTFIRSAEYANADKTYFNNIYYSVIGDNEGLLYFEVYVPNTTNEEEIMKDIDEILTSVKTFK